MSDTKAPADVFPESETVWLTPHTIHPDAIDAESINQHPSLTFCWAGGAKSIVLTGDGRIEINGTDDMDEAALGFLDVLKRSFPGFLEDVAARAKPRPLPKLIEDELKWQARAKAVGVAWAESDGELSLMRELKCEFNAFHNACCEAGVVFDYGPEREQTNDQS